MGGVGGGGGKYKGECLFHDNRDNVKYDNDNEYNEEEDGKRLRRGADDRGESNYNSCDVVCRPSFGGMGRRMSIVSPMPPPPSSMMTRSTMINAAVGGHHAPPLQSFPSRRTPLVVVNVANCGQWRQHEDVWGVVGRGVEEEGPCRCTHLSGSDPTRGG